MRMDNFLIGKRIIIVAEIGSNHNGNFNVAKRMIKEASKSKADAVKFQTYQAEKLIIRSAGALSHVRGQYKTQFERFKSLEFSKAQYCKLAELTKKEGVVFLSTPFDEESADFLDKFIPAFKISSGDLTNLPLIKHIIAKGKPILLSTGMATIEEIEAIVKYIPKDKLILMHCVSSYPTGMENANLRSILYLSRKFKVPVGYSDHTEGTLACLGAVALGACIVEKHFTLDKKQPMGDHLLSAEPGEFREMVEEIRLLEKALGEFEKVPTLSELKMSNLLRRSLAAKMNIKRGSIIKEEMLISLRPATGISPLFLEDIIGKRCTRDVMKGQILTQEAVA